MRVYELAKELGIPNKDLLALLADLGVAVKTHSSSIDDDAAGRVRQRLGAKGEAETAPPAEEAPESEPPPAPEPGAAEEAAPAEPEPEPAEEPGVEEAVEEPPAAEPPPAPADTAKVVTMRGTIVVKDFAEKLGVRPNRLIAELMGMNILASINERLEFPVARKIAEKHGFQIEQEKKAERKPAPQKVLDDEEEPDRAEDLMPKPPVITFLGHVDHGKTSLLDRIRTADVARGEHGGITQHIGAYTVDIGGRKITFLDTPGHAAFTAMRARGANLTDIAVIIVAADDGIMPQTQEAIMHARAADVPMMVAVNKTDLPTANVDRALQQLQGEGLAPEDWGGDIVCCRVSAETGEGIDHLLEMILLQADVLELKANPHRRAAGFVIEAQMEAGMGPTATLLVKRGTLKVGDTLLCGQHWGRVRALINDNGVKVKTALPGTPVKCLGLSGVPEAGEEFRVHANDKRARAVADERKTLISREQLELPRKTSLDSLFAQLEEDDKLELKTILKADTQGSVEAITHSLQDIKSDKVALNILLSGAGNITVNDVMLASASDAVVLGFHVAKESGVDATAKHEGVEIRLHHVIYELIDEVQAAMTGLLAPQKEERIRGHADIRQVFAISKTGKVAGCLVTDGTIAARHRVRVKRGREVLYEGGVDSLKHFQDSVAEVREPQECGVRLQKFADFQPGDVLEFYEIEEVAQTL